MFVFRVVTMCIERILFFLIPRKKSLRQYIANHLLPIVVYRSKTNNGLHKIHTRLHFTILFTLRPYRIRSTQFI